MRREDVDLAVLLRLDAAGAHQQAAGVLAARENGGQGVEAALVGVQLGVRGLFLCGIDASHGQLSLEHLVGEEQALLRAQLLKGLQGLCVAQVLGARAQPEVLRQGQRVSATTSLGHVQGRAALHLRRHGLGPRRGEHAAQQRGLFALGHVGQGRQGLCCAQIRLGVAPLHVGEHGSLEGLRAHQVAGCDELLGKALAGKRLCSRRIQPRHRLTASSRQQLGIQVGRSVGHTRATQQVEEALLGHAEIAGARLHACHHREVGAAIGQGAVFAVAVGVDAFCGREVDIAAGHEQGVSRAANAGGADDVQVAPCLHQRELVAVLLLHEQAQQVHVSARDDAGGVADFGAQGHVAGLGDEADGFAAGGFEAACGQGDTGARLALHREVSQNVFALGTPIDAFTEGGLRPHVDARSLQVCACQHVQGGAIGLRHLVEINRVDAASGCSNQGARWQQRSRLMFGGVHIWRHDVVDRNAPRCRQQVHRCVASQASKAT